MIRLVTYPGGQDLSLPDGGLSVDIDSPFFQAGAIPGTSSLPLDFPWTRPNLAGLNFPHLFRGPGGPPPVVVDCYVDGARWRRGRLVYLSVDAQAQRLRYNFVADAADLATLIDGVQLPSLELGTVPLQRVPRTADYALLPVRNGAFFGDAVDAPKGYSGYLNYWSVDADYPLGAPLAPQPYLVPLLKKVLALFGWVAVGPWLEDPEVQQLVVYSDRVLAAPDVDVVLARHVPAVDVADLLLGVQGLFCLGLYFHEASRQVRFVPLRDVAAGAPAGQRPRPGTWQGSVANATNGFWLQQTPGDDDELDKTLDTGWQQLRLGAGAESQQVPAGTLHLVQATDRGRQWLVPAYEGKGAAAAGDESRVGLRLLFDRGDEPDSDGRLYPFGSPLTTNLAGAVVGRYSLQWGGPEGLYATWHQAWLDFRARAVQHTYQSEFRIVDLLELDPARADLVDHHLCLWEQVSLEIDPTTRLATATFTYQELL